jgi:hypothetical protein
MEIEASKFTVLSDISCSFHFLFKRNEHSDLLAAATAD